MALVVLVVGAGLLAFLHYGSPGRERRAPPTSPPGTAPHEDVRLRGPTPPPSTSSPVTTRDPVPGAPGVAPVTVLQRHGGEARTVVRGVVLDTRGRPAGGVRVSGSWQLPVGEGHRGHVFVQTAESGAFELAFPDNVTGLLISAHRFTKDPPPTARSEIAVQQVAPGVTEDVVLVLIAHEEEIDGAVVGPSGSRVASGRICLTQLDGHRLRHLSLDLTQTDGVFRFAGIEAGRYLLSFVSGPKGVGITHAVVRAPATDVVLACRRSVWLEGRVEGDFSPSTSVLWRVPCDWGAHWTTGVDDDGRFGFANVVPEAGFLFLHDAEGGRYALIREIPSPYDDVRVRLRPGEEIGGTVRPVTDPRHEKRRIILTRGDIEIDTPVRPDGTFLARGLPPGIYALRWRDDRGWGQLEKSPVATGTTNLVLFWPPD